MRKIGFSPRRARFAFPPRRPLGKDQRMRRSEDGKPPVTLVAPLAEIGSAADLHP
jgi:hypothetical protein